MSTPAGSDGGEPLAPERAVPSKPIGRRVFLGLAGAGALGIAVGNKLSDWFDPVIDKVATWDPTGFVNGFVPHGRWTYFTVTDGFPKRTDAQYSLRVHGLVDRPRVYRYNDLLARRPTHITRDFQCVTGWRVLSVPWTGVRLGDILDEVGVQRSARALRFTSFDGTYTESLTLDQARRPDVLVAYQLEGGPISTEHGGPVRLYVAPMYGYKSIKWLDTIEVVDQVEPGYWEQNGYDVDGWVGKSNGRRDDPTS
jgi:DMSO/TMAO reductase YedYZ molybdopterin-dependent catalytic subunit